MLLSEIIEEDVFSVEELTLLEAVKMVWSRKKDKIIRTGVKEHPVRGKLEELPPFKKQFVVKKED